MMLYYMYHISSMGIIYKCIVDYKKNRKKYIINKCIILFINFLVTFLRSTKIINFFLNLYKF